MVRTGLTSHASHAETTRGALLIIQCTASTTAMPPHLTTWTCTSQLIAIQPTTATGAQNATSGRIQLSSIAQLVLLEEFLN